MTDTIATSALPISPAPRGTLQDHVYRQLCELILNGEIAPGQLITIRAIADAFGVSTMPVREALQRFTAARVLTVISSRSIGIPALTVERMQDLRRVRLEIEPLAADWAAARITEADLGELEDLVESMKAAARCGDRKQYVRMNRAFHFCIYAGAGSDVLMAIIENLWLQISPYFHLLHASGNYFKANEQHELTLDGLRARDRSAVRLGIRNDIEAAGRILAQLLAADSGISDAI